MSILLFGQKQEDTINTPSTTPMGAYHLAQNPELWEIQRSNNFEFMVGDIDNIIRAGTDGTGENATFPNAQEYLRIAVNSASVPHFKQSVIEVKRGNTTIKYAGDMKFDAGKLELNDYIGADIVAILEAWRNLSGNIQTEKVGLASTYKKTCYLLEYTPDGQLVRKWVLEGCWVSDISENDYNHEQNEKRQISVTVEYDKGYIDVSGNQ